MIAHMSDQTPSVRLTVMLTIATIAAMLAYESGLIGRLPVIVAGFALLFVACLCVVEELLGEEDR